jgi:hypothetical protein
MSERLSPCGTYVARTPCLAMTGTSRRSPIMVLTCGETVERATGIEPAWPAWKAGALPLSYARAAKGIFADPAVPPPGSVPGRRRT